MQRFMTSWTMYKASSAGANIEQLAPGISMNEFSDQRPLMSELIRRLEENERPFYRERWYMSGLRNGKSKVCQRRT